MKICYLTSSTDTGFGWGRYANDLIQGIRGLGHEVDVLTNQDLLSTSAIRGRLTALSIFDRKISSRLEKADVVHALDVNPYGILADLALTFSKKKPPIVLSAQGSYAIAPLYHWKTAFFSKRAYRRANAVIAISTFTKTELEKVILRRDTIVIPHGVDLAKFSQKHEDSNEQFILGVGGLKRRKGYHVTVAAFAEMKKDFPALRYKIVGEVAGPYADELKAIARMRGVEESIDFLGSVSEEELLKLYRTARIFIMLSTNEGHHFEGFGLVFLEAAAAGVPVVGVKGNGIEDAVSDGVNGILVPQNDPFAAANAVKSILANDIKWKEMSVASHTWAERHSLVDVVKAYDSVYSSL
jgi:glycosyltransferase involved in cell wall biosynthesis